MNHARAAAEENTKSVAVRNRGTKAELWILRHHTPKVNQSREQEWKRQSSIRFDSLKREASFPSLPSRSRGQTLEGPFGPHSAMGCSRVHRPSHRSYPRNRTATDPKLCPRPVQKLERAGKTQVNRRLSKCWLLGASCSRKLPSAVMSAPIHPWTFLVVAVAGWIQGEQQLAIDYLREENRVLRARLLGKRLRFTDDERRRLAVKGKVLGRRLLAEVAGIVTPDT